MAGLDFVRIYLRERSFGSFQRAFQVPEGFDWNGEPTRVTKKQSSMIIASTLADSVT